MDENLIGKTFNHLQVIGITKKDNRNLYKCKCVCGNEVLKRKRELVSGRAVSCGCRRRNASDSHKHLIGTTIGSWYVLDIFYDDKLGEVKAKCQCKCGTVKDVNIYNLINNQTKDCGCGRKEMLSETRTKNLVGQKFGRLTVLELLDESNKFNRRQYRCKCDCGNETIVTGSLLLNGHTSSCGCLISGWNAYIGNILTNLNINYIPEYSVWINGAMYRFDFYLPEYNTIIEYDGQHHYMPIKFGNWDDEYTIANLKKTQQHDEIKSQYCYDNRINLIRIPYWQAKNIEIIICNRLQRLSEKGSMI